MKLMLRLLLLAGMLGPAAGAFVPLSMPFEWLALKDGRRLNQVMLYSCDTVTGKVGALVGGEATTIALADLPDEVANRVRELAPPASEAEIAAEQQRERLAREQAAQRADDQVERTQHRVEATRAEQRQREIEREQSSITDERRERRVVATAAQELAAHYFTYEADPHSSVGYVFDRNVVLEDPEPIPGWTGQWRVRGRVGVQYVTNDLGMTGRGTRNFELRIEVPPSGRPRLLDLRVE